MRPPLSWIAMFTAWGSSPSFAPCSSPPFALCSSSPWVVATGCVLCAVSRAWVWGITAGCRGRSWVPGSHFFVGAWRRAAFWFNLAWEGRVVLLIKLPGRVGSGQPNSYRGKKNKKNMLFPSCRHIRHDRHGYGGRHGATTPPLFGGDFSKNHHAFPPLCRHGRHLTTLYCLRVMFTLMIDCLC